MVERQRDNQGVRGMGDVTGSILPLAFGVAISPVPIIAVILMLLAPRAGAASGAFLIGWLIGIVVTITVATVLAQTVGLADSGGGSSAAGVIKLILGAVLLLLAARQWRSRPVGDAEPHMPKWLSAMDSVTPAKATGLGIGLAAANPKNLLLILGAGVQIGQARLPVGEIVVVIVVFTIIAASTVAIPVIAYRTAPDRAQQWLGSLKTWLIANNATVMMILLAVIGVVLIGQGIHSL
jgi:threonine/homoserine/homoserine lactone efflux protein